MNWKRKMQNTKSFWSFDGLRRLPEKGKISGICAGIAQHWGVRLAWVRLAAIVMLIFAPMFTLIAYCLATFFITAEDDDRQDPKTSRENDWSPGNLSPDLSFPALRAKFKEIEERAAAMETCVTSPEFRLRRDFRHMGDV